MAVVMRLVALFLVAVALLLLGADVVTSLEKGGEITVRSVGTVWALLDKPGLEAFKIWVNHHAAFMEQAVYSSLLLPGWAVSGVIGVIIAFVFGRRLAAE